MGQISNIIVRLADDGKRLDSLSPRWTLWWHVFLVEKGGGLEQGGLEIDPDGAEADDGKRPCGAGRWFKSNEWGEVQEGGCNYCPKAVPGG